MKVMPVESAPAPVNQNGGDSQNRKKPRTQDGRKLRRYKQRRKIERLFAWLHNFRRTAMRFDFHDENYLGFVHLGCIRILLRCYL